MQSTLSSRPPAEQREQSGCGGNNRWPERGSAVNYFLFFLFFSRFSRLWQGCHGDAIRGPHKQSGWEGGGIGKCPCVPTHTHTHTHTAVPGDSIADFDILFRVNPPGLHREFIWASTRHHQCAGGVHNTWRFPLKCSLRFQVNYPPRAPVIFVSSPCCRKQMNQVIYLFIYMEKEKKKKHSSTSRHFSSWGHFSTNIMPTIRGRESILSTWMFIFCRRKAIK